MTLQGIYQYLIAENPNGTLYNENLFHSNEIYFTLINVSLELFQSQLFVGVETIILVPSDTCPYPLSEEFSFDV